jgi:hypothetical protein
VDAVTEAGSMASSKVTVMVVDELGAVPLSIGLVPSTVGGVVSAGGGVPESGGGGVVLSGGGVVESGGGGVEPPSVPPEPLPELVVGSTLTVALQAASDRPINNIPINL